MIRLQPFFITSPPNLRISARYFLNLVVITALLLPGCSKNKQANSTRSATTGDATFLEVYQQGDKFGYRDLSGVVIIEPQFAEAGDFSWGLARVRPDAKGGWGYIDASGNKVIPAHYEAAGDFVDGISVVLSRGRFIYIGPDGGSLGEFEEERPPRPLSVGDTLYVVHPRGLIERSSADLGAAPVIQIHPGEIVVCAANAGTKRTDSAEGLGGTWVFIRYKGKVGYLFDLYLSRYPTDSDHRPVERYRLVSSSLNNDEYSVYTLTKFVTGGRMIVHDGPNWTETQEVVPEATVDQVIARLKLTPPGELGSLASVFDGQSRTFQTEKGDTVIVSARRGGDGFLDNVSMSRRNEESTFDATISKYNLNSVQITTTISTQPAESDK